MTTLSICAPMYREVAVVAAFVARVEAAADATGLDWQLVVADDASGDGTLAALATEAGRVAARAGDGRPRGEVVVCALERNRGQLGATLAALERAEGEVVVVLDGDLQDPPEVIGALVERLAAGDVDAVFAVKTARDDAAWLRAAAATYHRLVGLLGVRPPPRGAGAFSAFGAPLAAALVALAPGQANLAVLIAALAERVATTAYAKAARYDGQSRVGALGLVREAWGSLALAGGLPRAAALVAALSGLAIAVSLRGGPTGLVGASSLRLGASGLAVIAGAGATVGALVAIRRRRAAGIEAARARLRAQRPRAPAPAGGRGT